MAILLSRSAYANSQLILEIANLVRCELWISNRNDQFIDCSSIVVGGGVRLSMNQGSARSLEETGH